MGIAVAIAVAVASSRVLLGVHWFTDVLAGLALGWAWFALGAIAFGGRLLRFGAPVEAAERVDELSATGAVTLTRGTLNANEPPAGSRRLGRLRRRGLD